MASYNIYGAFIESGEIISRSGSGYRVRSYSRDGVETPPIPYQGNAVLSAGTQVFYFMFPDGSGQIFPVKDAENALTT